ncbi:MAG: phosphoglycerate dehydrogenase [Deltaproteobacteria bacterium]|nr:phosphoglycerate dehydrogenase [Deltaproteobacteria bacterium]
MVKILISDKLSEKGLAILNKATHLQIDYKPGLSVEELRKILPLYQGLIIRSGTKVTGDLIEISNLQAIGRAGIGVDNVDVEAATKKGIVVMNTPSGNAVTTAEHAIAMIFAVSRRIPQANASLKSGRWEKGSKFIGSELCNKTLGVVGVGNIGRIVADRALGLKMKVIGYDPFLSREMAEKMGIELVELNDLFKRSDYITLHVPLNEKTRNLVDRKAFSQMKRGVYLINCARGGIVNEADLKVAIEEGIVQGAAFDVFEKEPPPPDHPFLKMDQVVVTPHLGAATDEAQENVAIEVAEMMVDFFATGTVRNAVNFPSISGEVMKILGPYIRLAEKLGSLEGQLLEKLPREIHIEYRGDISQYNVTAVTQSALKGLMSRMVNDVTVNFVNAPMIARDRGLKVVESRVSEQGDFASLVTLTLKNGETIRSISGTIFGKMNPRIVQIDDFYLEAVPEGTILVIHNYDRPGVIGNIGTLLGKRNINIDRMQLGMEKGTAEAIALYNVHGDVSEQVLDEIRKLPNIISVKKVVL